MSASLDESLNVPKGEIVLRFCNHCGYIGNETYEASKVTFDEYDFSNDHSPLFSDYIKSLCFELGEKHQLEGKTILDVGCGDGYFLEALCTQGINKGIGIDSGFDHSQRSPSTGLDVTYIQDYYSGKYADIDADLVTCRLVIDLLPDPVGFLQLFRSNLEERPDAIVFFEVPNASYTFTDRVIWNVVYEHRSWFTVESLVYLFELCNFEVLNTATIWNNEYLGIEAKIKKRADQPVEPSTAAVAKTKQTIEGFSRSFQKHLSTTETRVTELRASRVKVIAWGAGARSVSFLNLFDVLDLVPFIVDVNVKRQGKFVRGSGQKIVAPEFIVEYQPDLVIITNPTYAAEIQLSIQALGLSPDYWIL